MNAVSIYDKATGIIACHFFSSDESTIEANIPPGHAAVEGHHDASRKRVDLETGEIVDYTPPPPSAEELAAAERQAKHQASLMRIAQLEALQARPLREYTLGDSTARDRLEAINNEIASLRKDILKQ